MLTIVPRTALLAMLVQSSTIGLGECTQPTSPSSTDAPAASAEAATLQPPLSARDAVDAARRANDAEVQAFLANDPGTLARLWSDDFVVTNPFNKLANKQQVLAMVTSGTLAFSAYERDVEYAHAYGNIVILAGRETVHWAGHLPLTGRTSNLRFTAVWARHGNDWQEIARHANIIPPNAPTIP